jgi:hypothetical protein
MPLRDGRIRKRQDRSPLPSGPEQFEGDRQVLGGLELDVRILARELYGGRDLTVVRRAISHMRSTLDLLTKRIGSEETASPPGQGRSSDDPAARARQADGRGREAVLPATTPTA